MRISQEEDTYFSTILADLSQSTSKEWPDARALVIAPSRSRVKLRKNLRACAPGVLPIFPFAGTETAVANTLDLVR